MCQELWVNQTEVRRNNNCFCPLGAEETYAYEDVNDAYADLGAAVWDAISKADVPDNGETSVTVTLRRW